MLLTTVLPKSLSWRCVQPDLCGASKHKQNPAMSCKKLRKFILQFLWRKKTQLQAIIQYKVKKTEYHKIRKRSKGKQVLDLFLCCEGTLFYEAASRFFTCKEKNKMLKAQLIIEKRSNQYHTLTLVGTPALTACKHAACQQTALCWPALLMSQVRGGGKGIFSDRVPHLETWLLHLLLEASTWILDKMRERWNYQRMLRNPMACYGTMAPGRGKFPWVGPLMRWKLKISYLLKCHSPCSDVLSITETKEK